MMLVIQRIMVPLLLAYSSLAGCGVPNAHEAPPAFPWKTGDVIKAEYVGTDYGQGASYAEFITPDGVWISLLLDDGGDCLLREIEKQKPIPDDVKACFAEITPREAVENDSLGEADMGHRIDLKNLGRQFLLTLVSVNYFPDQLFSAYGITASRVQMDPSPNAPRHTKIIPYQRITGMLSCPGYNEGKWDDTLLLTTAQGVSYVLHPRKTTSRDTSFFCRINKEITLDGEFLLFNGLPNEFQFINE